MSLSEIISHQKATVPVIDVNAASTLHSDAAAIINHKGDSHMFPNMAVVLGTETDENKPLQIPHGRESDSFL